MQLLGKTVVVTGGGSGIGRALCEAFQRSGAKKFIVADVNLKAAEHVAAGIGGSASLCDVAQEADVRSLIEQTESEFGPIDLYCSNAGVALGFSLRVDNAAAGPDELWQTSMVDQRDGARLRCAQSCTAHESARRRLLPHHRFGRRSAHSDRKRNLFDHKTRRSRVRRKHGYRSQR